MVKARESFLAGLFVASCSQALPGNALPARLCLARRSLRSTGVPRQSLGTRLPRQLIDALVQLHGGSPIKRSANILGRSVLLDDLTSDEGEISLTQVAHVDAV